MALSAFLREKKASYLDAVKAGKGSDWTVVMGNEAGGRRRHRDFEPTLILTSTRTRSGLHR